MFTIEILGLDELSNSETQSNQVRVSCAYVVTIVLHNSAKEALSVLVYVVVGFDVFIILIVGFYI